MNSELELELRTRYYELFRNFLPPWPHPHQHWTRQGQNHRRPRHRPARRRQRHARLVLQFLKGSWHYGELDAVLTHAPNFVLKQMGRGFVKIGGAETDPKTSASSKQPGPKPRPPSTPASGIIVILDEINYAISYDMLDPELSLKLSAPAPKWSTSFSPAATPTRY